jgi:tetratricopeptide (TPR) repeat protein
VLGQSAFELGDRERACQRFKRSLTVCRDAGDKRGEANALWWLGKADLQVGDIASARTRLADALKAFRASEMWEELLGNLEDHVALAHRDAKPEIAVALAAAAALTRDRLRLARSPRGEHRWHAQLAAMRQARSAR